VPMRVSPSSVPDKLNPPQLAQSAIGQYDVRVTPLQMAMVSAAIANRGVVMSPYLVQTVRGSNLDVIDRTSPEQLSQAVTPDVAAQLTRMMEKVVTSGTGTAAQIPGVSVAGKTGTAQTSKPGLNDAWFIAFAPQVNPQIAVAVVVEDTPEYGGQVSAPIARQIIQAFLRSR
jgi:penicillin-binding protein A